MAKDQIFTIDDVRGGVNDSDSPTLLQPNQIVDARNVDFRDGALGAKRRGTAGLGITSAAFDSEVVTLIRHTPNNTIGSDELWGIDTNGNIDRRVGGTWQGGVATVNDHVVINATTFDDMNAVSLHGKLFIAANGTQDRLLCWDGTVLRWAGIAQPPDPTVGNTGAGSYTGTRYFRIRYTQQVSGVTVRRSEPTNAVSLSPSGTGSGALITKPSGTETTTEETAEGQTHWEVEASIDNILFYRIATVAIGTATYTDTTAFTTGYSAFTLSEQIGEYVPPGSVRHVAVDEDRLVMAGSHFTTALDSTVWWTPVDSDDGVGNDERIPTATQQFINFDGLDGGRVNSLVAGVAGNVYVFKASRIYKMVRTGVLSSAYQPVTESYSRGSTLRGAVAGSDAMGVPCAYFLDPAVGLCRIGQRGVEDLARAIRETWKRRVNTPFIHARIFWYPELEQVWYSVPLDDDTAPSLLFVHEARDGGNLFHDGLVGTALAFCLFPDSDENLKPFIGTALTSVDGGNSTYIHQADTGTYDSLATRTYRAYVRTKPYTIGNLWTKFGLMAAVMLGRAESGSTITLNMIRNFGVEERIVTADLTPVNSESHVVVPLDNAYLSELSTVQIEYGDAAASDQAWSLDQFVFKIRAEEGSA